MIHLYANFAKAETGFQLTYALYILAFLAYLGSLWAPQLKDTKDRVYLVARFLFLAAFLMNAYILINRGLDAGRPPFKTFYESLIYFGFIFGLLSLSVEWFRKARLLGLTSLLIILGALTFALHKQDMEIITLPPALRSGWFLLHGTFYFIGYSSVTVGFVMGVLALLKPGDRTIEPGSFWTRALGSADVNFENLTRDWIRVGFLFLTAGLVTGGLWAKFAWTDYWAWDPKENWGLISWTVYLVVLHLHYQPGFKRRDAIKVSLAGWGFILFTYFGMGYLPTRGQSMHLYTEPPPPKEAQDLKGIHKQMY